MRIYISVDMEGIAGVVHEDQTNPIDPRCAGEYNRFRAQMTEEANAAIEGALTGGATAVLVNDSHWLMRNLLAEQLHPSAQLVSGGPKTWSMMEGIEAGHDAAFFVGYHAQAGTRNAILDHTYTDRILDVRVNGTSLGELGLNALLAGTYNVPVAPHGVCSPLGTLAITHVCGVIPNLLVQEFTQYQNKEFTELCEPVKLDAEGFLPVPDAPGIGIGLNEAAVKERLDPEFKML